MTYKLEIRPGDDPAASRLEYDIFLESEYIDPNEAHQVTSYSRYPKSIFITATDEQGDLRGVMRLIHATSKDWSTTHFPTLDDFAVEGKWLDHIHSLPAEQFVEVGTMAVKRGSRGDCGRQIIDKSMRYIWARDIWFGLSSIDQPYFKALLRRKLPFEQIGEAKFYMGSVTVPTFYDSFKLGMPYKPAVMAFQAWNMLARPFRKHGE